VPSSRDRTLHSHPTTAAISAESALATALILIENERRCQRHDSDTSANDALTLGHSVTVGVEAKAESGNIILIGAVRDGTGRAAAEAMIAGLTGVRSITNDIQIRDDASPLPPYSDAMGQL
jgi:osmotically-inducible protein OsmY